MGREKAETVKKDNVIKSCDFIDVLLSKSFAKLGRSIGLYPWYFIIVPILLALLFATGFQQLKYQDDPEYLFSPTDGRSKHEKRTIDTIFPMNYTENFNAGRITSKGRFGRLIIVANDGGNIIRSSIFSEIVRLDSLIRNMTIEYDDEIFTYDQLCAKTNGRCYSNDILDFSANVKEIEEDKFFLKYPIWLNRDVLKAYFFPSGFGGVTTDQNSMIESAKAASLMYFLDTSAKRGDIRAGLWEEKFLKFADTLYLENVTIAKFVSTTLKDELEANTQSLFPFFSVTTVVMVVFSVATCMMFDWVRSKPWLGLLGCVSAGLGVAASFGICAYCGVEMIGINLAAPFLMLGVGMDDAFVLLAAWRQTDYRLSVADRLGHTYAEAAVSISITSITNFISFVIGTVTPFPSVRIFCIYTAVAVLVTYIFHICFFGACIALFGEVEAKNLHGLTCVPIMPKSVAKRQGKSWLFIQFCTGGHDPKNPDDPLDNTQHAVMIFFRDVVATALNKASVKVLVIAVFILYLAFGIYGCTLVKEGLDRRKLSRDDSYSVRYYDYEDRFFREYPYRVQVVMNQTLNYADPSAQEKIEKILTRFESSKYIAESSLTESWLRAYLKFIDQDDSLLFLQSLNLTNQDDFYTGLRSIFLNLPMTEAFRHDIVWNEDKTEIVSSRFVIQTKNIRDANMEKEMLLELRAIADEFKEDNVTIFNHLFIFFDQFILVREISLQTITFAALVMMAISIFLIPSYSCAIWVAFSIMSIEIGVVGYMTHWGVNLDSISMINLIMCIGFSVDFSAHISYAYISCQETTPEARVRSALYSLGLPIFQGSLSTILGIVALAFAPSYVFVTFFKTVFLVMLFGATHGVLLLPVLLSLTDGCFCGGGSSKSSRSGDLSAIESVDKYGRRKGIAHKNNFPITGNEIGYPIPEFRTSRSSAGDRVDSRYYINPNFQPDSDSPHYRHFHHHNEHLHHLHLHHQPHHPHHHHLHDRRHHQQLPLVQQEKVIRKSGGHASAVGAPIYIPRVALNDVTPGANHSLSSPSPSPLSPKFCKYSSNWDGMHEVDSGQETKTSSSSSSIEGIDLGIGTSGEELSESSDKSHRRKASDSSSTAVAVLSTQNKESGRRHRRQPQTGTQPRSPSGHRSKAGERKARHHR